ncbi:hypothetical protein [Variovorax sp. GB1P17]|uniref:hypothetical protein n=1 Tax=Variovorax sp. GB1P17 TaxID=3443740 RepID=UPI003F482A5C
MTDHQICDACECVAHCSKRGCIPISQGAPQASSKGGEAVAQAFDAFLCRAWGETDLPSAELVADWEGVRRFMVREWLGEEDDEVLLQIRDDFAQHEEDMGTNGGPLSVAFEIGGVSIERVCGFAAKDGAVGHEQAGAVALLAQARYFVGSFALKNPRFEHNGAMQDPSGSHALLAQIDALLAAPTVAPIEQAGAVAIISGEPATAHSLLAALIDINDDAQNNAPEHRCYVDGAWGECLSEARSFLAAPSAAIAARVQEDKS